MLFVVETPPNFEADPRRRKTEHPHHRCYRHLAGRHGANSSLALGLSDEIQSFLTWRDRGTGLADQSGGSLRFNPNLKTSWFSAMTQVISHITLLTAIPTAPATASASRARSSTCW